MNCTKLSDFEKQCPNVDCNTAKCPIFRKVVIPSNMGSDEEGQPYAPENGAYENALVYYEASGVSYIYSSDGIYTKIAQITGGQSEVISVNGKKGVVTITIDELDGLTADQIVSRINSAKAEDKAYTDAKIAQVEAEISTINSKIPAEASVSNQLSDKTFVSGLVSDEASARELADTNLQGQIDAITSASDVVDVVGTYSELQAYDTQHLKDNDIVKVLVDETHDNAITYYRWTHSTTPYSWIYIGSQGPFYTKAESDTLLNEKADKSNTYTKTEVDTALAGKVDKVAGKGLSTNDFTTEEKTKLAGLENTVLESSTGQSTTAGMTQKAITDALASAGGAKVLTAADYNYPVDDPTSVALWKLTPGIYYRDNSSTSVKISKTSNLGNDVAIVGTKEGTFGNVSILKLSYRNNTYGGKGILTEYGVRKTDDAAWDGVQSYVNNINAEIVDSLTSDDNSRPLSANQGKVLKDLIDSLVISGAGAPTTSTVGTVGMLYEDTTNGDLYKCTAVSGSTYTWEEVGGGENIIQVNNTNQNLAIPCQAEYENISMGGDSVFVGCTNAPSKPTIGFHNSIYGSVSSNGLSRNNISLYGWNSEASGNGATSIGARASSSAYGVAVGMNSTATQQGEFSIGGSGLGANGYNGTSYRKITNVYDGENAHDACTKGQLDAALAQIQALEARIAALEGNA